MGESAINIFEDDLAYADNDDFFNEFYKKSFPNVQKIKTETDMDLQFKGIDKTLTFESGLEITIDEKKRRVDYGDILLEIKSNEQTGRLGWLYTAQCDYIAYAVMPTKTIYFLPMILLKMTWLEHGDEWIKQYGLKRAKNQGYVTVSVAVPTNILLNAMKEKVTNDF